MPVHYAHVHMLFDHVTTCMPAVLTPVYKYIYIFFVNLRCQPGLPMQLPMSIFICIICINCYVCMLYYHCNKSCAPCMVYFNSVYVYCVIIL